MSLNVQCFLFHQNKIARLVGCFVVVWAQTSLKTHPLDPKKIRRTSASRDAVSQKLYQLQLVGA